MQTEMTAICVWLDDSTPEAPAWIVSRDSLLIPSCRAASSRTLMTFGLDESDARGKAWAFARETAAKAGLPLRDNAD